MKVYVLEAEVDGDGAWDGVFSSVQAAKDSVKDVHWHKEDRINETGIWLGSDLQGLYRWAYTITETELDVYHGETYRNYKK